MTKTMVKLVDDARVMCNLQQVFKCKIDQELSPHHEILLKYLNDSISIPSLYLRL